MKGHDVDIPKKGICGVYMITNRKSGKFYVGSAKCLRARALGHLRCLRHSCHENSHLQNSYDKYGEGWFDFETIEECDFDILLEIEQYWLDALEACKRGYNQCPVAGSVMAGRNHTPASKEKMSEKRKGIIPTAATEAAAAANKGKKRPEEVRQKIAKGNKGKPKSEEHKAKTKATHWSKRPDAKEIAEKSASKNRGRKHSAEHNAKISEGNYRRWQNYRTAQYEKELESQEVEGRQKGLFDDLPEIAQKWLFEAPTGEQKCLFAT